TQYQVTQPLNGDSATLRGVEVASRKQLRFLPGPLDGVGVYANLHVDRFDPMAPDGSRQRSSGASDRSVASARSRPWPWTMSSATCTTPPRGEASTKCD